MWKNDGDINYLFYIIFKTHLFNISFLSFTINYINVVNEYKYLIAPYFEFKQDNEGVIKPSVFKIYPIE